MIAYLTHDEVNASVATRLARRLRAALTVLPARIADQLAAHVLLVDLDGLPREWRANLLARAAAGRLPPGLAIHSYQLSASERRQLRTAGVRVSRRLTAALVACVANPGRYSDRVENDDSKAGSSAL